MVPVVWKLWYAITLFFFFNRNFTKQQYHVISHMLPESETLALLQADLLVKQIWFMIQFSSREA